MMLRARPGRVPSPARVPVLLKVTYACLGLGSAAGLAWLAPLEYRTGQWLGLGAILAVVVPALIDSYVALAVLTARDRVWALPVAAVSGMVGQLHAAGVLPEGSVRVRAEISVLAVLLAVCVTARLKPLAGEIVRAHATGLAAERDRAHAAEEARTARSQAHALEIVRLEAEGVRAQAQAHEAAVRLAHETDMERARAAHAHEQAMAAVRAPVRTGYGRALPVRAGNKPAGPEPAAHAHASDDLSVRRIVRGQWSAREDAGRRTPNSAVARTLGIETGPARALVSRWRKERSALADRATAAD